MKEKHKQTKETPGGGGSLFDAVPGLPDNPNVSISCGPHAEDLPVAGMTVGEVRRRFKDRFDIDNEGQSIINGNPVDETHVLKSGENLMFIKHAGEKGGETVTLEGHYACTGQSRMKLATLWEQLGTGPHTGNILPDRVRGIVQQGSVVMLIYEQPPAVHWFKWLAEDSQFGSGGGAKFRKVSLSLPYLVMLLPFVLYSDSIPYWYHVGQAFFRNQPLSSFNDPLYYPMLLNCLVMHDVGSVKPFPVYCQICSSRMKEPKWDNHLKDKNALDISYMAGVTESVRHNLLEMGFNNDGFPAYTMLSGEVAGVFPLSQWEENTRQNPNFATTVNWYPVGRTLGQVITDHLSRAGLAYGPVSNAEQVAKHIINLS